MLSHPVRHPKGSIRDIVGGRSATYERELRRARDIAIDEMKIAASEMGANAVVVAPSPVVIS
jgi:uncharacterized protein YbjQ (UPF0145 family)